MPPVRIIIADDEFPARQRIRRTLEKRDDCEILAECCDGPETLQTLLTKESDVLFLDIQMPELNGFEVLANLPSDLIRPAIIFTTAFDQYAISAFEVCAIDYLLKPWKSTRLLTALDRAIARRPNYPSTAPEPQDSNINLLLQRVQNHANERIAIRDGERLTFLRVREIDYLESAGNYVIFHTKGLELFHRETLTAMEKRLAPHGFFRANRSNIINLNRVLEVKTNAKGGGEILLERDATIPLTRPVRELQAALSSLE